MEHHQRGFQEEEDEEEAEGRYILARLGRVKVFSSLTLEDKLSYKRYTYEAQESIVVQGEASLAGCLYILERGRASVIVNDKVVNELCEGDLIGERGILLALSTRTATVVAKERCEVLGIMRSSLERALGLESEPDVAGKMTKDEKFSRLKKFSLLGSLSEEYIRSNLVDKVRVLRFAPDEVIFSKGDAGSAFYLIDRGSVGVVSASPAAPTNTTTSSSIESPVSSSSSSSSSSPTRPVDSNSECDDIDLSFETSIFERLASRLKGLTPKLPTNASSSSSSSSSSTCGVSDSSSSNIGNGQIDGTDDVKQQQTRYAKVLRAGQFFGEAALMEGTDGIRSATCKARTYCTLLSMDKEAFKQLMQRLERPAETSPSPKKKR